MIAAIGDHRGAQGVGPIRRVLPIAPPTDHDRLAQRPDPARRSDRARRDEAWPPETAHVSDANDRVRGVREVRHQMRREGGDVARRTVARPTKGRGAQAMIRGKPQRTTIPDNAMPCPPGRVNRRIRVPVPDTLRLSAVTDRAARTGFVDAAVAVDARARRLVGWRVALASLVAARGARGFGSPRVA